MPLRDHFHPPLSELKNWEGFHGLWPGMITVFLNRILPTRFEAEPCVHVGSEIEVDIATLEDEEAPISNKPTDQLELSVSQPSLAVETELLTDSEYEVRVYDTRRNRRLVAAIEIVSPSNKGRPESRRVFAAKCRDLLRHGVSVSIVDVVTARHFNLYIHLLELIGETDPVFLPEPSSIYAVACRWIPRGRKHYLETWAHKLQIGQPLPTLPLWLAENFYVPLDLEATYEETCHALRIS